jgi:hypothetical protein
VSRAARILRRLADRLDARAARRHGLDEHQAADFLAKGAYLHPTVFRRSDPPTAGGTARLRVLPPAAESGHPHL